MKLFNFCGVMLGLGASLVGSIADAKTISLSNPIFSPTLLVASSTKSNVEEFIVRGNEPFWSVTIARNGIVYSTPEIRDRRYPYIAPRTAQGRPPDLVRVYRLNGQPSGMLIIKKTTACSDTMSDTVYPYQATLILGDRVLDGCAQKR
jgi:uncharacterized membrane protein